MSFLLKPVERAAKERFENSLESGESRKCFSIALSYFCNNLEAKDMSAAQHGAERQHRCVMCHSPYEDIVMGRASSSCAVTKKVRMPRRINSLQEETGSLAGRGCSRRWREVLKEIDRLLSE